MQKIVVIDDNQPETKKFFDGLAAILGDQFICIPATVVAVHNPQLAERISWMLSAANEPYYWLPEEEKPAQAGPWQPAPRAEEEVDAWRLAAWAEESETGGLPELIHTAIESIVTPAFEEKVLVVGDGAIPAAFLVGPDNQIHGMEIPETNQESVDVAIEERAKGKREKKAAGEKPTRPVGKHEAICKNCLEPFTALRGNVTHCNKPECQKAHRIIINQRYQGKRKAKKAAGPTEAAPEAVAEVPAVDNLPVPTLENNYLLPEETPLDVAAQAIHAKKNGHWVVEDGIWAGSTFTTDELHQALERGDLTANTHLMSQKHGKCKVIRFPGKQPHFAVKQLSGEHTNSLVQLQ